MADASRAHFRWRLAPLALGVALSGCSQVADGLRSLANSLDSKPAAATAAGAAAGGAPLPPATVRQQSPDEAVRSHFDYLRRMRTRMHNDFAAGRPGPDTLAVRDAAPLYSGLARDLFEVRSGIKPRPRPAVQVRQEEEILEVKVESETRAIVNVRIRYLSEPPTTLGASAVKEAERLRAEGDEYRFVMRKVDNKWTIENVLEFRYPFWDKEGEKLEKQWRPLADFNIQTNPDTLAYPSVHPMYPH